ELLRLEFKEHGFAIATAANGQEAVRKTRSLQPDLVLLDVMLPDVNGFAVCELLRRDESTARVPVLMVSGMPGELPRCTGFDSGATDFVSKPISPSDLVARVKALLRGVAARPCRTVA
ncbi:MAG TPA: response regulator, partial [Verrucomicrobiota bacterium]|nr:response regulator [Verrucomicrobiota bacterium]